MAEVYIRYFCESCPLADECSDASWKKTKQCQSWVSEEEVMQLVRLHLTRSGHHSHHDHLAIQDILAQVVVQSEQVPKEWFDEARPKRQRTEAEPIQPVQLPPPPPARLPMQVMMRPLNDEETRWSSGGPSSRTCWTPWRDQPLLRPML